MVRQFFQDQKICLGKKLETELHFHHFTKKLETLQSHQAH